MIIKTLRALEMPLEAIAVVLEVWNDAEAVRAHLKRQRQRLETDLETAERRLSFIDRLLDEGEAMPYEVATKELDAMPVVMARTVVPIDELGQFEGGHGEEAIYGQIAAHLIADGVQFGQPSVCVIHSWTDDSRDASYGYAVTSPTSSKGLFEYQVLDGGRFLSILHVGPPDGLHAAFAAMEESIQERGMSTVGPWRLLMHDDMLSTPEQDLRWELVAPIP